jgi:hypothetical protein
MGSFPRCPHPTSCRARRCPSNSGCGHGGGAGATSQRPRARAKKQSAWSLLGPRTAGSPKSAPLPPQF